MKQRQQIHLIQMKIIEIMKVILPSDYSINREREESTVNNVLIALKIIQIMRK